MLTFEKRSNYHISKKVENKEHIKQIKLRLVKIFGKETTKMKVSLKWMDDIKEKP